MNSLGINFEVDYWPDEDLPVTGSPILGEFEKLQGLCLIEVWLTTPLDDLGYPVSRLIESQNYLHLHIKSSLS